MGNLVGVGEELLGQAAGAVAALCGRLGEGADVTDKGGLAAVEHTGEVDQGGMQAEGFVVRNGDRKGGIVSPRIVGRVGDPVCDGDGSISVEL